MWNNYIEVKELTVETRRNLFTYYYLIYSERFLTLEIKYLDKFLSKKKTFYSEIAKKHHAFYHDGDWYFNNKEDAYQTKSDLLDLLKNIETRKSVI